jgi:hypothetical protein
MMMMMMMMMMIVLPVSSYSNQLPEWINPSAAITNTNPNQIAINIGISP